MKKAYWAEMFGTMFLVLMGCGSAVFAGANLIGVVGISLAFGLTVLAMVYAIGPVSGCHINPAITTAMVLSRGMDKKEAGMYILFQIIGAALGGAIIYMMASNFFSRPVMAMGQNAYVDGFIGISFVAEMIFTALFILVILGVTAPKANTKFAGIAIGLTLVLIHIVCIPITGTSVNPARSIGPALFAGIDAIKQLWLFIVAPLAGAALGSLIWYFIGNDRGDKETAL